MFSFFKKKPSSPAPGATSTPAPLELDITQESPVEAEIYPEPELEPLSAQAPAVEEEPEPLLTFEEWDRILAEQEAANKARAEARTEPGPPKRRFDARGRPIDDSAPPKAAPMPMPPQRPAPKVEEEAPLAPVVNDPAPEPPPEENEEAPQETPLEALVRRCNDDPYDADLCHSLARLAYSEKQPHVAVAPLVRTAGLIMSSDSNTAIELLTRLLNMRQDTIHSDLMLAEVCLAHDRMREAEQALKAALRIEPENHTAAVGMIRVSLWAKRPQEAIEFCHRVLAVDQNGAQVWEQLGDAHVFTGNVADATDSWLTAARLYGHAQAYDDAIRVYSMIVMIDPNHPSAAEERANLGYVEPE